MENLISSDLIGCLVIFLAFTLNLMVLAKARRSLRLQQREHLAHPTQFHFTCRPWGACRPHGRDAAATVYERSREGCLQMPRAPAHGKERTPC